VTSVPEGFTLPSTKVSVIGQGIDASTFRPSYMYSAVPPLRLVTVGRVAPVKRPDAMIDAVAELTARGVASTLDFVGPEGEFDPGYIDMLQARAAARGVRASVRFRGAMQPEQIACVYAGRHAAMNMSRPGAIDKAGLEAMCSGLPLVTSNHAYASILDTVDMPICPTPQEAAGACARLARLTDAERSSIGRRLHEEVVRRHSLDGLMDRLVGILESVSR
jgi:glycosyltransferase involved in cell wall biosynthesis